MGRHGAIALACASLAAALALAHAGELRGRASAALGEGMPAREAALARGFVLGEDEGIDAATVERFRRSGLAHLLAVSGQNVALLLLLAMPLLAALGMGLRARLLWMLGLIAAYVAVAGAGPSIQRAGVMGALSVLATLGGRRASRLYALALAALVTLAIDPRIARDVGWQLSFAAVLGILCLAAPLREALGRPRGRAQRALLDAAAMTIAATLATAPLVAFHFGEASLTTLVANLLALPAVAPAMWLGMLAAAAGQLPGVPVEPLNWLGAPLLAYVAQVATWCGSPDWAAARVRLGGGALAASYAVLAALALALHRRRSASLRTAVRAAVVVPFLAVAAALALSPRGKAVAAPPASLRVTVLDVGQGDAILLQPGPAPAVLVDGGPDGDLLAAELREAGVERLGLAVVTHDQEDHAGGIEELAGRVPVERLLAPGRLVAGDVVRAGRLRLEAIWPPRAALSPRAMREDPNRLSLVLLARWGSFRMLLAGDAEAEAAPIDPGPLDVLKVAHHGSEDAGLAELLRRTAPRLAVISVGEGNGYGHPSPATLGALAARGVPVLRTDRHGTVVLEVSGGAVEVEAER